MTNKFPKCPCGGDTKYFGEALMGSLTCEKCGDYLMGVGIEFIRSIGERWIKGERGDRDVRSTAKN
jgi:hypothetical protein